MKKKKNRGEEKKKNEEEKKKEKKRKKEGFSRFRWECSLSFEGGFHKVLREWIPGFGGRKEGR